MFHALLETYQVCIRERNVKRPKPMPTRKERKERIENRLSLRTACEDGGLEEVWVGRGRKTALSRTAFDRKKGFTQQMETTTEHLFLMKYRTQVPSLIKINVNKYGMYS